MPKLELTSLNLHINSDVEIVDFIQAIKKKRSLSVSHELDAVIGLNSQAIWFNRLLYFILMTFLGGKFT